MEPSSFLDLGKELINFEAKAGNCLTIELGANRFSIKTDNDFSNPSLGSQIQTSVGQFRMGRKGTEFTELVFTPKLSDLGSLNLNFLTGKFKLQLQRPNNRALGFSFDSDGNYLSTYTSDFKLGKFDVNLNSVFDGKATCTTVRANASNFGIRSKFTEKDKEIRFGLFKGFGPFNFGASAAFDYGKKSVKEARLYSLVSRAITQSAFIVSILPDVQVENRTKITSPFCPKTSLVLTSTYNFTQNVYSGNFASSFGCKCGSGFQIATNEKLGLKVGIDTKLCGTGVRFTTNVDSLLQGKKAQFTYGVWVQFKAEEN
jgi:hypothetical protein